MKNMVWKIKLHELVKKEDTKKFSFEQKERIKKQIKKKLSVDPEGYGEPLIGDFKGYYKLRVEDTRVIYTIIKDEILVLIIKVGIRKDDEVYEDFYFKLKKMKKK